MAAQTLQMADFYPTLMNLYGDRGNVMALRARCAARGIQLSVETVGLGDEWDPEATDIVLIGGGQDREQRRVAAHLQSQAGKLRDYRDADKVLLAVCGGYQLFGRSYRGLDGEVLPGAGVFDAVSVHPGRGSRRCVGDVVALWEGETLVGFENHGGRTYLNEGAEPLAAVVSGFGNNGGDGTEGARVRSCFGTYLHGALLPKNPRLADRLIGLALARRYGERALASLDDVWEARAHAEALHAGLRR